VHIAALRIILTPIPAANLGYRWWGKDRTSCFSVLACVTLGQLSGGNHAMTILPYVRFAAIVLILWAGTLSCADDATAPQEDDTFSLRIEVRDTNGMPVSGLRVSAWNDLESEFGTLPRLAVASSRPTTVIKFAVETRSRVELLVHNLRAEPVDTMVTQILDSGEYTVVWDGGAGELASGVYGFFLTARDTASGEVLWSGSQPVTLWLPDPDISVLGSTDASGVFETTDELLFPNVLDPPAQTATNELGEEIDLFTLGDTLTIVLTDIGTMTESWYRHIVTKGPNVVPLVWAAGPPVPTAVLPERRGVLKVEAMSFSAARPEWVLYKPFPNPFN
jgi:hypothetical protein